MTKDEAKKAMLKGEKVTHKYFSPDEYITGGNGTIIDEKGYRLNELEFWSYRTDGAFNDGWSIFN